MAQAIHDQLDEPILALDAARKVVEMLAGQSKAVAVIVGLPGQLSVEPICEAGYGSGWVGNTEGIDLEGCERDEICCRDGNLLLATVSFYYQGVPRNDGDRVNDKALAEFMLSLLGPRIKAELRHLTTLSEAEAKVAQLLHRKNDEIAGMLCQSKATTRNHIKSIYRKLGVSTRKEVVAIMKARQWGEGASRTPGP